MNFVEGGVYMSRKHISKKKKKMVVFKFSKEVMDELQRIKEKCRKATLSDQPPDDYWRIMGNIRRALLH